MKISSKIMALTMTALLSAAPAQAADSGGTFSGVSGQKWRPSAYEISRVSMGGKAGFRRCGGNMCNLVFTSLDMNANGSITRGEFHRKTRPVALFSAIDVNHNGVISKSELDTYNSR